jgi:hypothetical protein
MLLNSGVFRHGHVPPPGALDVLFYRDGRTASVAVFRTPQTGAVTLTTNGKPDASLSRDWFRDAADPPLPLQSDRFAQKPQGLTALAHRPHAQAAAVVGFGSGMSSHVLLGSPELQRLTTVEIEPVMVEAARQFYPANRRAFDDARAHVVVDDAKSFFAATPQRFDLILSEPSNPWVSGVSSLFGGEFYDVVAHSLTVDGVFAQWLQLYEINDELVLSVLAAVNEHFGDYAVFVVGARDVLIVATKQARLPDADWSVRTLPAIAGDLGRFTPLTPQALDATRFLDRNALAPVFHLGFQPNSDFFPILDVGAEEARYLDGVAAGFLSLSAERFALPATLMKRRAPASETTTAVRAAPLFELRARAARLHAALANGDFAPLLADAGDADAGYRLWQWHSLVASGQPADWGHWVADTVALDADLHVGSAGEVDERFYAMVHGYLDRHAAPPQARAAMRFVEAIGRWDFATAAPLADTLLAESEAGHAWLPPHVLLDGAVVAKLRQGDVGGARRFATPSPSTADVRPAICAAC